MSDRTTFAAKADDEARKELIELWGKPDEEQSFGNRHYMEWHESNIETFYDASGVKGRCVVRHEFESCEVLINYGGTGGKSRAVYTTYNGDMLLVDVEAPILPDEAVAIWKEFKPVPFSTTTIEFDQRLLQNFIKKLSPELNEEFTAACED